MARRRVRVSRVRIRVRVWVSNGIIVVLGLGFRVRVRVSFRHAIFGGAPYHGMKYKYAYGGDPITAHRQSVSRGGKITLVT